jgi:hypothetical protein
MLIGRGVAQQYLTTSTIAHGRRTQPRTPSAKALPATPRLPAFTLADAS